MVNKAVVEYFGWWSDFSGSCGEFFCWGETDINQEIFEVALAEDHFVFTILKIGKVNDCLDAGFFEGKFEFKFWFFVFEKVVLFGEFLVDLASEARGVNFGF